MIKILLGGSPCTHWSIAQKNNRETTAEGIGWELFKNYLIAKEKFKPDYFLYENNKSAAQPIKDQISKELGIPLQYIKSALVSAQNRQRFYAHNIPGVELPEDRGILLKDILESGFVAQEKAYCLCTDHVGTTRDHFKKHQSQIVLEPIQIGTIENQLKNKAHDSKQYRVYSPDGKVTTVCGQGGGVGAKTGLYLIPIPEYLIDLVCDKGKIYEIKDNKIINTKFGDFPCNVADGYYIIRKLTVTECKRLQTVPEWYQMPCSASQNYKMLGNGWTVEVIKHILSHIPNIQNEEIQVLSMYDGMSCGQIALTELGCNISSYHATEIDKYAIQTTQANFPNTIQLGDAFQVREPDWGI